MTRIAYSFNPPPPPPPVVCYRNAAGQSCRLSTMSPLSLPLIWGEKEKYFNNSTTYACHACCFFLCRKSLMALKLPDLSVSFCAQSTITPGGLDAKELSHGRVVSEQGRRHLSTSGAPADQVAILVRVWTGVAQSNSSALGV